jgi:hypothetical protein
VSRDQSVGHLAAERIPKLISDAALFCVIQSFGARSSRGIWKMEKSFSSKQKKFVSCPQGIGIMAAVERINSP